MFPLKTMPQDVCELILKGLPPESEAGLFGLPFHPDETSLMLLGVPWEPTASYGRGTSETPHRIIPPSYQLDLFDPLYKDIYRYGIAYDLVHEDVQELNSQTMALVEKKRSQESSSSLDQQINKASAKINGFVYERSLKHLKQGQFVGVLGGDHSCPLGLIQALGDHIHEPFGILHIDAHHDLRAAYEGHTFSHASIMHNVLAMVEQVSALVQVGIRDFSFEEAHSCETTWKGRVYPYRDLKWQQDKMEGQTVAAMVETLLKPLPEKVYISFDIDGLEPTLCPHTGTPVPGGLSYGEIIYILRALAQSGRKIIGFDLCEVGSPKEGEWDLNVGARILYQLCGSLLYSQSL